MKLYTLQEIANILNMPDSTVRAYRNKYEEYFVFVGEGRKRRYLEKSIDVVKVIREESDKNKSHLEILDRLDKEFGCYVTESKEITVTAQQQQEQFLNNIATLIQQNAEYQNKIDVLIQEIAELKELVQIKQQEKEKKESWWDRWKK